MPLNWAWRSDVAEDLESEVDVDALKLVEERILELRREIDEVWNTNVWRLIDEDLAAEFAKESRVFMSVEDIDGLKLARERARVIARLRRKPEEAEQQLQELHRQRRELLGEEETPEEE